MNQRHPFFSIIIPTYARPQQLTKCLQACARIDYPSDRFEVIVVDDGDQNPSDKVVAQFREFLDITLVQQQKAGPAAGRNTGASLAKGDILAFTDDDCMPDPNWLKVLSQRLAAAPNHMIGGRTVNALSDNLFSYASQMLIDYLCEYFNVTKGLCFFTTSNLAIPKGPFRAIGTFDQSFPGAAAEDREFCARWQHRGYKFIYAPEAVIYHAHSLSLRKFCRQHFNYGKGAFRFHQIQARSFDVPIKVEPSSFYSNMLLYPFKHASIFRALPTALLLLVSQLANGLGFIVRICANKLAKRAVTDEPSQPPHPAAGGDKKNDSMSTVQEHIVPDINQ